MKIRGMNKHYCSGHMDNFEFDRWKCYTVYNEHVTQAHPECQWSGCRALEVRMSPSFALSNGPWLENMEVEHLCSIHLPAAWSTEGHFDVQALTRDSWGIMVGLYFKQHDKSEKEEGGEKAQGPVDVGCRWGWPRRAGVSHELALSPSHSGLTLAQLTD